MPKSSRTLKVKCPNLMKPKSRKTLGKKISLAYKPKRVHYKYMRPNVKIYKHIPLEREIRTSSQAWRRWKEDEWRENPWRFGAWPRGWRRWKKREKWRERR